MNLVDVVNDLHKSKSYHQIPAFKTGDTVAVHVKIKEGEKTRIQVFQGTCVAIRRKKSINGHFRIRKLATGGMGVERVFPYHSPNLDKVVVVTKGKSRRAKLYYLRDRSGKDARIAIDFDRK